MKRNIIAAAVLSASLAAGMALPVLGAEPVVITYLTDHGVMTALDVDCAPSGIVQAGENLILVTDTYGKQILKVENGACSVYAGAESVRDPYEEPLGGYNDAKHIESLFRNPWAIAPFLDGCAVSDPDNNCVRMLRPDRTETVNADTNENLVMGDLGVEFANPTGLATDPAGNLYISDTDRGAVRLVNPEGYCHTVAANLDTPTGLCWYGDSLYIAETGACRILRIGPDGKKEYLAGSGEDGYGDGPAGEAMFSSPQGIAVGPDGTIYVADTVNGAVRRIRNGQVDTLVMQTFGDLRTYPVAPRGLLVMNGTLYICDNFSHKIFMINL